MERGTVNPKVVGSSPTIGALFTHLVETTVSNKRLTGPLTASAPMTKVRAVRQTFAHVVVDVRQRRTCIDLRPDRDQQFDACAEIEHVVGVVRPAPIWTGHDQG